MIPSYCWGYTILDMQCDFKSYNINLHGQESLLRQRIITHEYGGKLFPRDKEGFSKDTISPKVQSSTPAVCTMSSGLATMVDTAYAMGKSVKFKILRAL